VGEGEYLLKFVKAAHTDNLVIGWAKGYRGLASMERRARASGQAKEEIRKTVKSKPLEGLDRFNAVSGLNNPFKHDIGDRYIYDDYSFGPTD
jgi:hypothetical protein